jgi:hypothetical protein
MKRVFNARRLLSSMVEFGAGNDDDLTNVISSCWMIRKKKTDTTTTE